MDEKKIEITRVAMQLFADKGYNYTSVEEIAKECGMAKGSFYKYFNSKEDLLLVIFALIPKQIEESLTKIYRKTYASRQEKLIDFISLTFENMQLNQVHLLMSMVVELPLSKDKEMVEKLIEADMKMNHWYKELLVDLYGDLQEYIWDLTFILKALMFNYMHIWRYQKSGVDIKGLAVFIATVIDIVIKGLLQQKPKSVLHKVFNEWEMDVDSESPRFKAQKIQSLLKQMSFTATKVKHKTNEQADIVNSISLLEEEITKKQPKRFLLKALIHYIQGIPELESDCESLKVLLELE